MERIWESKEQRDDFFTDLRALIEKYPNLGTFVSRQYSEDPAEFAKSEDGYPYYDPDSPMFLDGLVLVITHTNVHNWESLVILEPYEQSMYKTMGLLTSANTLIHEDGD